MHDTWEKNILVIFLHLTILFISANAPTCMVAPSECRNCAEDLSPIMSDAVEDPALTSWKAFERRTDGLGGRQTIGQSALARSLAHSLPLPSSTLVSPPPSPSWHISNHSPLYEIPGFLNKNSSPTTENNTLKVNLVLPFAANLD